MTPAEIATTIELEANGIEAHADPMVRALSAKMRWWAGLIRTLPMVTRGGNLADMDPSTESATPKSLLDACHDHNLSLRELGGKVGVSHAYLSAAAAGRKRISDDVRQLVRTAIGWDQWPKT